MDATRPGGLVSLLTRNRAGIAMRAGMSGDWTGALAGFDARRYENRLGLEDLRADEPGEVEAAFAAAGWEAAEPPVDFADLLAAEEQAGRRDPYRALAALTHTIARRLAVRARSPGGGASAVGAILRL